MTHRVMLTALYNDSYEGVLTYFGMKNDSDKILYCDAMLSVEAGCKYALASGPVDEIIVFGHESLCSPEEHEKAVTLLDEKTFYQSDIDELSAYDLLKYRLAEYLDDLNLERQDSRNELEEEEKKLVIAFLRQFFAGLKDPDRKFSRMFHYLAQDKDLFAEFTASLNAFASENKADPDRYMTWVLQYLYHQLKATSKPEALDINRRVQIRFMPVSDQVTLSFMDLLMELFKMLGEETHKYNTELYIYLQDKHSADMFSLLNAMNLTKVVPDAHIHIGAVMAELRRPGVPANMICDRTAEFSVSELLAGAGSFLSYGKTDILVDYWERTNLQNPRIDRMIYAMRNIDTGISLCDVADIERGIKSLRQVIMDETPIGGNSVIERYFEIVAESVRRDYGPLLQSDKIDFIELVKWAYRKEFWQQTLTLIESNAPNDFVDKGIYYYSNDEESRNQAVEVLGQIYYDLKPYEKYKLEDISHYYVKYYSRQRTPHSDDDIAYAQAYADVRVEELDIEESGRIKALTECEDREALRDLLFSYYHLGDIRNSTNHAADEFDGFYSIIADTDPSERKKTISRAVDYFIHCYDKVSALIGGKDPHVEKIDVSELVSYSRKIRDANRRNSG